MTTNVVSITHGPHRARVRARRDELVLGHLSLAAGIAHAVARTLPRAAFEREDLVAEAYAALIGAATTWRPEAHGDAPFACWARLKVRGAVLDAVRDQWSDGRHKHGTRPLTVALDGALDGEPGAAARFCAPRYAGVRPAKVAAREAGLAERLQCAGDQAPERAGERIGERIDEERRRAKVARAIATLPSAEVAVLERKYGRGEETFAEIAARLAMPRGRVAALHASAIAGLRRELQAA